MNASQKNIIIDPDFETLCRKLTDEEYSLLETSILESECREAILLWNNTIIDGHNRYQICATHNLRFRTQSMDNLGTKDDVILWIIENQMGRRNLTDIDKVQLLKHKRSTLEKQARERMQAGRPKEGKVNLPEDMTKAQVRDQLASEIGISGKTYAALEVVNDKGTDELKDAVRKGFGAEKAAKIAKEPKEKQHEELSKAIAQKKENASKRSKLELVQDQPKTSWTAPDEEQGEEEPTALANSQYVEMDEEDDDDIEKAFEDFTGIVDDSDNEPPSVNNKKGIYSSEGWQYAEMAIDQLKRIRKDDPNRKAVINIVTTFIKENF